MMSIQFGAVATPEQIRQTRPVAEKLYGPKVAAKVNEQAFNFYQNVPGTTAKDIENTVAETRRDGRIFHTALAKMKELGALTDKSRADVFYRWQFQSEDEAKVGHKVALSHNVISRLLTNSKIKRDGANVLMHFKAPLNLKGLIGNWFKRS